MTRASEDKRRIVIVSPFEATRLIATIKGCRQRVGYPKSSDGIPRHGRSLGEEVCLCEVCWSESGEKEGNV